MPCVQGCDVRGITDTLGIVLLHSRLSIGGHTFPAVLIAVSVLSHAPVILPLILLHPSWCILHVHSYCSVLVSDMVVCVCALCLPVTSCVYLGWHSG